ncbi:inner membrane protein, bestrophin family [Erwinia typographi]|uniref:Inner membrane protein, bestrophin family n=1 Tax=Erwinia typographi TaxID=371042 RepID=A0A0A3ZB23_9GAMM|nr:bestrophin family ion channel [Erwinia typographi]KGT94841.1 inner membrane protein, bestrophin family [Erwinia typographi]
MIIRPHAHWFVRLFSWHGSVLSGILFRLGLNLLMSVVAIFCLDWYETLGVKLTLAPFSLLGVSIAIFLGFRNSVCYARFTEARLFWGGLLIACRTILRQVHAISPADAPRITALLMAFCYSLKHQLRKTDPRKDLQRYLGDETDDVLRRRAPTNVIEMKISRWLGEQRRSGAVSDIVFTQLDDSIHQLSQVLGGCERLASMPLPFAYGLLLHRTVYLFCTLLPFALVPDLHYMTPLVSVFISYTFLSLDTLAEELEMPFGYANNHLPMDAMCTNIEINLLEMNNQRELPETPVPDRHYRLT